MKKPPYELTELQRGVQKERMNIDRLNKTFEETQVNLKVAIEEAKIRQDELEFWITKHQVYNKWAKENPEAVQALIEDNIKIGYE